MANISAKQLSEVIHGKKRAPTEQQSEVTEAPTGPTLVVAGAGAGKTETMAARVIWLVANGIATPDQILGLTFTRKAAQELGRRIRTQLHTVAGSRLARDVDPTGELADLMVTQRAEVSTYDSYAGNLIREYGLLVPVEPHARLITQAELYSIAHQVVTDYAGRLSTDHSVSSVAGTVLDLITEMDNDLLTLDEVGERTTEWITTYEDLPKGPRQRSERTKKMQERLDKQYVRLEFLPLVAKLKQELSNRGVVTFNEQMAVAAKLVRDHASVVASQRRRFRVVMLDEYQDTSHAQRILLSHLFGSPEGSATGPDPGLTVTAVGDPMQAIYGWRGATVENLEEFVNDFPSVEGPAEKLQLTTSWRNPGEVLELANAVSEGVFFPDGQVDDEKRPVAKLQPKPDAGAARITLAHFETEEEEITAVADELAAQYRDYQKRGEKFTGAALIRKNRHAGPIAEALAERGVPHEILGVGGLLEVAEIMDLVALATMLIRPDDNQAALRILGGPVVGLGLADIVALQGRARNLNGSTRRVPLPEDPTERLKAQLEEVTSDPPEQVAGLTDAVADLGEHTRYSAEGLVRLQQLASKLRYLRTHSLGKSMPDLFADIESVFDLRTEVLARVDSHVNGGAVHLDRFLEVVADYQGDSLAGLLAYFQLAREHEKGLEPGEISVRSDRVQILTVHKAKGLEWEVVAVVHVDNKTYAAEASTYLTNAHLLPDSGMTERLAEVGDRKEMESEGEEFITATRNKVAEENARLFYVAITRTEKVLLVTASNKAPYGPFAQLALQFPQYVTAWAEADRDEEGTAQAAGLGEKEPAAGIFPHLPVPEVIADGAEIVAAARETPPAPARGETFEFWEREVTALIEEHEALQAPVVDVELPGELTATDMVSIKADPLQFAKRQRRPVPFKPNVYAKRGTEFHQWLEELFGGQALLDEDELPGIDEEVVDSEQLDILRANFLASPWADRVPERVEHPFEVAIGGTMVRGRMDAVFREADGSWLIVDWKTGRFPTGAALRSAEIQLAVYREAWRRVVGAEEAVSAAFFYVSTGETFAPTALPDGAELAALLRTAVDNQED